MPRAIPDVYFSGFEQIFTCKEMSYNKAKLLAS